MLESIKQTIQSIADFFSNIIDFVVGFIEDTVNFIKQIPQAVSDVIDMASSFMPVEIIGLISAALAVVVVLRVVGRD